MNPIIKLLISAVIAFIPVSFSAFASNNVSEIDVSAIIQNDGSARITQNWHGSFNEGTENYIPIRTGDIGISDLKVSDSSGEYTFLNDWDIDADFDAKKRKCGINKTEDGVELCFGITQYGENSYTIEYTVTDFIKSYSDYDGTNFMLINPNMSTFPTDGKIDIELENGTPLSAENAAIWAFGFDGEVVFRDGHVSAYTSSALDGDNSMIVMLQLNKGIIAPSAEIPQSFEDVKSTAFDGSDYGDYDSCSDDNTSILEYIIGFFILFVIFAAVLLIPAYFIRRRAEIKSFYRGANYFRDVPNHGDITVSYFLARNFGVSWNDSFIIGTLMLSMINKGFLEPETTESIGMFGKTKQSVNLRLCGEPDTEIEKKLYSILSAAAGKDGILQEKELENYAYRVPNSVPGLIDSAKLSGETAFSANGGFIFGAGKRIKDLSDTGKQELAELMGLKKYLEDFSLIAERGIEETVIWKDYLVYATLFGIADKVILQLKKVYPDKLPEIENYSQTVFIAHSYYRSMQNASERARQEERTSGLGGSASIGGGGGFSGGGSGGGSR